MIILTNPTLFKILPNPPRGMALYPFILIRDPKDKDSQTLIHHEKIHLRQQLELLIVPFYILYLINYVINLIKYQSHFQAYLQICFEQEAYVNEQNLQYLKTRKTAAFLNYL